MHVTWLWSKRLQRHVHADWRFRTYIWADDPIEYVRNLPSPKWPPEE